MDFQGVKMRLFPIDDPMKGIGGTIIDTGGFHKPSATDGPLIYLNGNPDLQIILDRVNMEIWEFFWIQKAIVLPYTIYRQNIFKNKTTQL